MNQMAAVDSIQAGLTPAFLLLGCIVLFSYTTQAITGFGSTVIALALSAHIYSIPQLLPVLVGLNLPLCLYFVIKHRQSIESTLVFKEILPWMSAGVTVGLVLLASIPVPALKPMLGILIVIFAVREGIRLMRRTGSMPAMSNAQFRFWTFASGITHGIYASGGPLLVYAVSRKNLGASVFRSTMMTIWLFFNFFLIGFYAYEGRWSSKLVEAIFLLLPLIPIGIYLGEVLHHRISVRAFWFVVQSVLLVSGVSFLV